MDWLNFFSRSLLTLLFIIDAPFIECHDPEVDTKSGKIRGSTVTFKDIPVDVYYGIPFATPPVGNLRFKRTVPVKRWHGIWNATHFPPACHQLRFDSNGLDKTSRESEDCLYLNVWAPSAITRKEKKAVMIWIYGGNFVQGSGIKSLYSGLALAALGDVIIVTLNYRLSSFGFLTSGTEDAPGNQAMYDQVEAIKWTNENIEAFGGDISRITLFGESAGAISVSQHAVSPLTKNLFQRAIMASASAAYLAAEDNNRNLEASEKVAEALGCANKSATIKTHPKVVLDCLRKVDAATLAKIDGKNSKRSPYSFLPQYGDSFLPTNPRVSIIEGNFKNCDLIIGSNADEGSRLLVGSFPEVFGKKGEKRKHSCLCKDEGRRLLREALLALETNADLTEKIVNFYISKVGGDCNEKVVLKVYTALGDYIRLCPTVYTAEKSAQQGNVVYYYFFTHRPSSTSNAEWMGIAHFDEVQFVFGKPLLQEENYTKEEISLSMEMVELWTNFAKTGTPYSNQISWPHYSRQNPFYQILNTTTQGVGSGPHEENCNFLRSYFGF